MCDFFLITYMYSCETIFVAVLYNSSCIFLVESEMHSLTGNKCNVWVKHHPAMQEPCLLCKPHTYNKYVCVWFAGWKLGKQGCCHAYVAAPWLSYFLCFNLGPWKNFFLIKCLGIKHKKMWWSWDCELDKKLCLFSLH